MLLADTLSMLPVQISTLSIVSISWPGLIVLPPEVFSICQNEKPIPAGKGWVVLQTRISLLVRKSQAAGRSVFGR